MNLEQLKARMGEIFAALEGLGENENLTNEQVEQINALHTEYESVKGTIEAKEKMELVKAHATTSSRKVEATPVKNVVPRATVIDRHSKTMGFEDFGTFAQAIADKSKGKIDNRFNNATAFESTAEDGGILIPKDFLTEIQDVMMGQDSLLAMSSNFSTSGNYLSMPVDEEQPWSGGIQAYWTAEGAPITDSKSKLSEASFKLNKLAALVKCTDELLEDASAIESYIRSKAPAAMLSKINSAIIGGDGVGKPSGLLNSGFKITVAKEGAQAVDSIVYENIIKMEARLIPGSKGVWIAHPECKEQLRQLKDANGNHIYMNGAAFPNMAATPFDMLMGKPVIYMMGAVKQLGDEGDLILADMKYYYSLVKSAGVKQSVSTHLYFDRDLTAFKFTQRIDGHCPFSKPVQTENGAYDMSGIITLEAR